MNFIEALGSIQDTDNASEATALARYQILTQAANAIAGQANSSQKSLQALVDTFWCELLNFQETVWNHGAKISANPS